MILSESLLLQIFWSLGNKLDEIDEKPEELLIKTNDPNDSGLTVFTEEFNEDDYIQAAIWN
jgi:hypothetical protein